MQEDLNQHVDPEEDTDKRPVVRPAAPFKPERKTRKDKGTIIATRRDLHALIWIAEQYAARGDQIRRLVSRWPDPLHPFEDESSGQMAESTARGLIARWQQAGWVEYQRVLADEPGYAWVSRRGLALVGLDEKYTYRIPASTRFDHYYAVNQVRFWAEDTRGFTWQSEREFRAGLEKPKKGESFGPIPDGVVTTPEGHTVAIEVELSAKKPEEVGRKLRSLAYHTVFDDRLIKHVRAFPSIWFFVHTKRLEKLVKDQIEETLREEDHGRFSVGLWKEGLAPKVWRPGAR